MSQIEVKNDNFQEGSFRTREIIAKCLKQFDLRLFEEIGGKTFRKKPNGKIK